VTAARTLNVAVPGRARRMATAAVLLGLVMAAFETTVVTTAMPTLTAELGGRHLYAWVFTAFLLASTLGVLVSGGLADGIGRRATFLGGLSVFLVGTILCGFSRSVPQLIAFRMIQGLGAGALQPTTLTIASDIYNLKERAAIQSVFTGSWGTASVIGPILGAYLTEHASWRWVFWVNVPVGVAAALLLHASYRDPVRPRSHRLELTGPLLAGATLALTLFALEPRHLAGVFQLLATVAAAAAGVVLVRHQLRARRPLLPLALFRDQTVVSGLIGGLVAGGVLYGASAYVPLWLVSHGQRTALTAGAALVPLLVGWAVGSAIGVKLLIRGGLRASAAGGFAVAAVGAVLLALALVRDWGDVATFSSLAILGFGLGPAASTSIFAPQQRVPWHQRGAITSTLYACRMLGGSLAIAVLNLAQGRLPIQAALLAAIPIAGTLALLRLAPPALASGPDDADGVVISK
jgi:EmrB/QacA subfamily drug resistance transporter